MTRPQAKEIYEVRGKYLTDPVSYRYSNSLTLNFDEGFQELIPDK